MEQEFSVRSTGKFLGAAGRGNVCSIKSFKGLASSKLFTAIFLILVVEMEHVFHPMEISTGIPGSFF